MDALQTCIAGGAIGLGASLMVHTLAHAFAHLDPLDERPLWGTFEAACPTLSRVPVLRRWAFGIFADAYESTQP